MRTKECEKCINFVEGQCVIKFEKCRYVHHRDARNTLNKIDEVKRILLRCDENPTQREYGFSRIQDILLGDDWEYRKNELWEDLREEDDGR